MNLKSEVPNFATKGGRKNEMRGRKERICMREERGEKREENELFDNE